MTTRSLRLGIDLDGVVADFNAGWTALHNAEFGGSLTGDMVTSWNGLHTVAGFDTMDAFWNWARPQPHRPSIFRHLDLLPDALDALRAFDAAGHRVVIITTKPDWSVHETLHWLAEHAIPTREVHLTEDKFEVDCDLYVDDSPHVLPTLVEHHPDAVVCRFVRPWNEPLAGTVDVKDWADVHAVVTQTSSGRRTASDR